MVQGNGQSNTQQTLTTTAESFLHANKHFQQVYDNKGMTVHMDSIGGATNGWVTTIATFNFKGKDGSQHSAQITTIGHDVTSGSYGSNVFDAVMDGNWDMINNVPIQ